jgi:hypothetical protein
MTKKDYIALAKIIKDNTMIHTIHQPFNKTGFMEDLCQYLKSDNPLFNETKFREACNG